MKVLLLQDVKGLGKSGDIVKASDGYARNYLIPKKMAVVATPDVVKKVELQRKAQEKKRQEEIKKASEKLNELMKGVLVIHAKAGKGEKLYGAVTSADIAKKISEYLGEEFDRKNIDMEPIKSLGTFDVKIKLGNGVSGKIKVKVEREETEKN
ncbi:50S ribosomal protein L9 [Mesoaciditoga lauensis]|uniref:50S ribosomal protein L9 n=1 Tax=Mesoaciditoga lauensis TaxID=1495039 RepID=UPI00055A42E2|nr:50S ribosomal protein L9 [Mesoaciditoga lauensis]